MRVSRKLLIFLFFLTIALCASYSQDESGIIPVPPWKMAVLRKNASGYEPVPFRQPLSMSRRDAYRLYLAFEGNCCCYVIQEDDEGKLPFIYRRNVSGGEALSLPGGTVSKDPEGGFPEEPDEFPFSGDLAGENSPDPDFACSGLPGTSRLYVIVSSQPKPNLERLMDQFEREPVRSQLERSILSEVLAIRRGASPRETDRASGGGHLPPEGRDTRVITVTVRVR